MVTPRGKGEVDPLSPRAVVAGCAVGLVVSAMNVSFGLKAGWSQGGRCAAPANHECRCDDVILPAVAFVVVVVVVALQHTHTAHSHTRTSPPHPRACSVLAAAVSIGVFSALRPRLPFTQLEANICQTVASAAGSMTMATGLIGPIPALHLLGIEYSVPTMMLWGMSVAGRCSSTLVSAVDPTLAFRHFQELSALETKI